MNWKTIVFILILLTGFGRCVIGQTTSDIERLKYLFPIDNHKEKIVQTKADWSNEFMLIMTAGFNIYKKYVSSQDAVHCAFYPSCSIHALETIKVNGFLGIFDAIDRLTRCNSFSPENYTTHPETHRFYDPIRKIR